MSDASHRKIHVDLPRDIHRKLRIKAALEDVSLQAFVTRVLTAAVKDVELPAGPGTGPEASPPLDAGDGTGICGSR